ncbi:acetyl-CoA carboxylase biotin carboxyl carrier protein [Jeotgalibacillus proteolyticus]|uniref:Biotin carboxyl carrier protein of acetyl-CoA carboxylase n=1 Tax=Jeotgalibacillus proteolyticus TaxID=2082395 RepID=A0A2S5GES1_9BACL|nr:acetyl-CoA carboxylase biotin carboxyl carrier protein [Jeotgalibacillus proteolyticus]PPA71373.1 acetyl-CoA carboxylase, biotin carboxyl carrier protein [Jeotgalibacillus proteolyticus]
MLKVQEIRELIKLIDQSSIDEFTYEHDGGKIKLKKQVQSAQSEPKHAPAPVKAPQPEPPTAVEADNTPAASTQAASQEKPAASAEGTAEIKSPMVGTFYHASSPDAEPFVKVGSKISEDSTVCIVEAMKLFNEIEAEVAGEIVEILVKDGQLVEYGQPLFLVKE